MKPLAPRLRTAAKPLATIIAAAALVLVLAVLAGVFKPKVDDAPRPSGRAPRPAGPLGEVTLATVPRFETAVGTIRAVHEAAVASKILARVTEVNVAAGQKVAEGDVMVRLDDADLAARLQQAQADTAAAQATFDRAQQDFDRTEQLLERRAVSRAEFDAAAAAVKTAEALLDRSQRAVDEANVLLEYATIRAPLSGVVVDKRVEPGDTATPGEVLVTLYDPDRMQMLATVRESLGRRLKVGDQIPARIDALEHECLAAVSEIVPQAESASRSFTVKVTGPCPPGVYSGMFGRISIPLDDEQVVVVPAQAVIRVGQLDLVDVVINGDVRRRSVRIGRRLDDAYEVLAGLKPGEKVVLHRPADADERR
jgi:RND family efflux transporter MFP subunit